MEYLTNPMDWSVDVSPTLGTDFGEALLTGFLNGFNLLMQFAIAIWPVMITIWFVSILGYFVWRKLSGR